MPANPTDTITTTTRDADGVVWLALEKQNAYLHGEIDYLRDRLERVKVIEEAATAAFRDWYNADTLEGCRDSMTALNRMLVGNRRLDKANGVPAPAAPAVSSSDPCPDVTKEFLEAADIEAETPIASSFAPAPSQTEAERENDRLRDEVEDKDAELYAREQNINRLDEARDKAERERDRLRAQLDARGMAITTLKSEADSLRAEVEQLTRWLADSKAEVERVRGIEAALTARWQQKIADAETALAASQAEAERLKAQVKCEDVACETVWAQKKDRDAKIAELRNQLAASQAREAETAETLRGEIAELQQERDLEISRADELRKENAGLRSQLARHEAWEAETAKRCEAVVDAVGSAYTHTTPLDSAYDDDWWAITRRDWKRIQLCVDTLRQSATTEAKL